MHVILILLFAFRELHSGSIKIATSIYIVLRSVDCIICYESSPQGITTLDYDRQEKRE